MAIRLIATDMDGTLLNDDKINSEVNLQALRTCLERGIYVVPATGRTAMGVPKELRTLPGVRYVIAANGACVFDLEENRELCSCRLSPQLAVQVMELARASEDDIMYDAYQDGAGYTMPCFHNNLEKYTVSPEIAALVRRTRRVVDDNITYIKEQNRNVDKINMFFVDMEARMWMRDRLKSVPGLSVTSSLPNNLEINALGADKGRALLFLIQYLGLKREETMAVGDGENDLSMIRAAGIGVAMANGLESVKNAASHITLNNNEGGVAAAINQLALPEEAE